MSEVTRILTAVEQGDAKAADELLPLVYEELRRVVPSRGVAACAHHRSTGSPRSNGARARFATEQ